MKAMELRSALSRADEGERRRLLSALTELDDPEIMTVVVHCLGDPAPAVCEAAVAALGRAGSVGAAHAATAGLRSPEAPERSYALEALIQIGAAALPVLTALLQHPDRDLRRYAVEAIAALRDASTVPMLTYALHDPDVTVAATVAEALGALGRTEAVPALRAALLEEAAPDWMQMAVLDSLSDIGGAEALAAVVAIPPTAPPHVLAAAASAVGKLGKADLTVSGEFLMARVVYRKPLVQEAVLEALAGLLAQGLAESGPPLALAGAVAHPATLAAAHLALGSRRTRVRAAAVACLTCLDQPDWTALRPLLADPAAEVREAVVRALWRHNALKPADLLLVAAAETETPELRRLALTILRRLGPLPADATPAVAAQVKTICRDARESSVRAAAACALLILDPAAGMPACAALLTEEELVADEQVAAEFAACPLVALAPFVGAILEWETTDERSQAWELCLPLERATELARVPGSAEMLELALGDADWRIRAHTVRLLEAWSAQSPADQRRWAPCLTACATQDAEARVRAGALGALLNLGALDDGLLLQLLADGARPVRRAALWAAGQRDLSAAPPPLRQVMAKAARAARQDASPELVELGQNLLHRLGKEA